jgi:cell division protein FtsI (penicillin-binding protein 3)
MSRPLDRFFGPGRKRRSRLKLPLSRSVGRVRSLLIVVAVVFSLAAGRAVQVQAIDATNVAAEAADQMTVSHVLPAFRGTITDRNGEVLAQTQDTVKVIADARMIRTNGRGTASMTASDQVAAAAAPAKIAAILVQFLGGVAEDYLPKLTATGKAEAYQKIAEKVPAATFREIQAAMSAQKLVGLSSESQPTRVYPNGSLAANVIGAVNSSGVGASGLEYALNSGLAGTDGKEAYETSPNGRIPLGDNALVEPVDGTDYQLTIDSMLQWQAEQVLADRVRKTNADNGMLIAMNPKTGEVLALAQYPTFDPNDAGKADQKNVPSRAVTDPYTPGSVQKTLTLAALIDMGLVKPSDVVTVPERVRSGDQYITDAEKHGKIRLYVRGVLAKSSNIGTILLSRKATKQSLHDYYTSFGLGQKTGIGLQGESSGILPAANMPDYARDGLAFGGSAVAVTLVQEAAAVAAIANGGVYNQPRLIGSATTGEPHRVVSADTAADLLSMMETMAQQSASHTFDVAGYRVGAKTGTSKKFDTSCNCFRGLVTSAISVAPVEDPQVLVYVVLDNPKRDGAAGGSVAGPVVQDVMSVALARYGVPQSTGKVPRLPVSPDKLK